MSVRRRLEDAHFLLAHGRDDGALLSACAALSATSRERYPDRKAMGDREAFTRFLGEETRVVTAGGVINFNVACPGADPKRYPTGMMPLQDVLYSYVRCQLSHEAEVADNVEFLKDETISVDCKPDRIVFGGGVLRRLLIVAEYAPENWREFREIAEMPREVVGWMLFGQRRGNHADYLAERERRLVSYRSVGGADRPAV